MSYQFEMYIGDWSCNGHERCDTFIIQSKKPVQAVREAHFRIPAVTGINIEKLDQPRPHRLTFDGVPVKGVKAINALGFEPALPENEPWYPSAQEMAALWVFLLNKVDPELELSIVQPPELEMLHFYGCDEHGRTIGAVGYNIV